MTSHMIEKIFVSKMKYFLREIIVKFNHSNYKDFVEYSIDIVNKEDSNKIIQLYYFDKFFQVLKQNKVELTKDINSDYLNVIDHFLVEGIAKDKSNVYQFFVNYGNFRKPLLHKLYEQMPKVDHEIMLSISKIFLINQFTEKPWEQISCEKIKPQILNWRNHLIPKLVTHLNKTKHVDEIKNINFTQRQDINISKTQDSLNQVLNLFSYPYLEEYEEDGYAYDYFIPDLNTVIEYLGPDHFYPCQTQLREKDKFRYSYISQKRKVLLLPYYEYLRHDTEQEANSYIKRMLFKEYDLKQGSLFYENYDIYKHSTHIFL